MMQTGSTLPIQSIKSCVVYDAESGRIFHHHRVLTLMGGREPGQEEIARDALHAARNRRNPPRGSLQVLQVHHEAMEPGRRYRVDVQKRALLAEGDR